MIKQQLSKLLPMALQVAKYFAKSKGSYEVESRYMSNIASFGIDILNLGMVEAVISYQGKGDEAKDRYHLIPAAVLSIAKDEDLTKLCRQDIYDCFYSKKDDEKFEALIIQSATALKYAIRTYSQIDNT